MKTPEEIKYGLASHGYEICDKRCAYHDWRGTGYDCCSMLCQDAHTYIEKLEAKIPLWIPVEERLPAKSKTVLVVADGMVDIACFSENGWGLYTLECCTITHWMPMPEPPEEAKTNG